MDTPLEGEAFGRVGAAVIERTATHDAILSRVLPAIAAPMHIVVAYLTDHATDRNTTVETIARGVSIPRRTLCDMQRRARLPGMEALLTWFRLLHAAWYLEGTPLGDSAARRAGFTDRMHLNYTLHRHMGCSVDELAAARSFEYAVTRFLYKIKAGPPAIRLTPRPRAIVQPATEPTGTPPTTAVREPVAASTPSALEVASDAAASAARPHLPFKSIEALPPDCRATCTVPTTKAPFCAKPAAYRTRIGSIEFDRCVMHGKEWSRKHNVALPRTPADEI